METDAILVTGGVVAIVAGAVGGGIKLVGGDVPVLTTKLRQLLVFMVGVVLLFLGLFPQLRQSDFWTSRPDATDKAMPGNAMVGAERPASGPAQTRSEDRAPRQNNQLSVTDLRSQIRDHLNALVNAGDRRALLEAAARLGMAPEGSATEIGIRIMVRVSEARTAAETREIAAAIGVPLEAE